MSCWRWLSKVKCGSMEWSWNNEGNFLFFYFFMVFSLTSTFFRIKLSFLQIVNNAEATFVRQITSLLRMRIEVIFQLLGEEAINGYLWRFDNRCQHPGAGPRHSFVLGILRCWSKISLDLVKIVGYVREVIFLRQRYKDYVAWVAALCFFSSCYGHFGILSICFHQTTIALDNFNTDLKVFFDWCHIFDGFDGEYTLYTRLYPF